MTATLVGDRTYTAGTVAGLMSGGLPATKTHGRRGWHWLPTPGADGLLGVLTVTQGRSPADPESPRVPTAEADSYRVYRDEQIVADGLVLVNHESGLVYFVRPAAGTCAGGEGWCERRTDCKHRDAVRAVAALGGFDPAPGGDDRGDEIPF